MCSTLLHKGTVEAIDAKRCAFIWTGDATCTGGQCKAAWDLNKGLLSKFLDKLLQEPTTNWQRWFHMCYETAPRSTHLGNGQFTSFWFDHWIGPQPLAELFPAILSFCQRPNISVQHAFHEGQWLIPLHPRLSAVASSQWAMIQQALADVNLLHDVPDRRGIGPDLLPFSSRAFYRDLWDLPHFPDEASPRARSTIITAVLWNIWKARNSVVFNSTFVTAASTRSAIVQDVQLWSLRARSAVDKIYLNSWCNTIDVT
ncbi:hypothetical protein GQ55_9G190100 [Panicum hallii var. hallii]|uniref:Reverse transcriptase zinc-binding domain-containing protein n=1 Tax=Panicum hallii var. hallii TaxID=1504633 RepID=A0A2T7C544_9POAL|nr:hypothetical protein GQ55_9G190100 [Panicum hallii var. hallii]